MDRILTPDELARYEAYVRPQVEGGQGVVREAVAYLAAMKPNHEAPAPPALVEAVYAAILVPLLVELANSLKDRRS